MPADFFPTDPDENAASLSNLAEVMFGCLDAAAVRSLVEVGAFHGKSTRDLLAWAEGSGVRVIAVDPAPEPGLTELAAGRDDLELIAATSHDALRAIGSVDAVILDGDHNYYTLSEELRLIEEGSPGAAMPLVLLHDMGWPHARRDSYYAPERIPAQDRQPLLRNVYLAPWEPRVVEQGGLPFACVAEREGGPRNGTLTAVEDFIGARDDLAIAVVPAFFGLGVLWHRRAPWAAAVEEVVAPWDRNPLLERLEANRIRQMVERYRMTRMLGDSVDRGADCEELLRTMLGSRAFAAGEQLSRIHGGGRSVFSREAVRRALGDE
jgi:hypothetical protein